MKTDRRGFLKFIPAFFAGGRLIRSTIRKPKTFKIRPGTILTVKPGTAFGWYNKTGRYITKKKG